MSDEGRELSEQATQSRVRRLLSWLYHLGGYGWRRAALRIGIPVLLLVAFVLGPGYVATQPSFLGRYAKLDGPYRTWQTSVHAKVPCQSCHVKPDRVAQIGYDLRMVGEFYLSAVSPGRDPQLFDKPTNEACRSCHPDWRTVSPSGDLNIPHRAHVQVLKIQCIDCHRYLVHEKSPEGGNKPTMTGCLRCHDGKTAKNACSACHTDKVEPLTHRAPDWLKVHPTQAGAPGAECNKCHAWTQHWCADCHAKRPKSHTAEWRSLHGAAVAKNRDCEACHASTFCIRCHGVVPSLNYDPSLKLVQ